MNKKCQAGSLNTKCSNTLYIFEEKKSNNQILNFFYYFNFIQSPVMNLTILIHLITSRVFLPPNIFLNSNSSHTMCLVGNSTSFTVKLHENTVKLNPALLSNSMSRIGFADIHNLKFNKQFKTNELHLLHNRCSAVFCVNIVGVQNYQSVIQQNSKDYRRP